MDKLTTSIIQFPPKLDYSKGSLEVLTFYYSDTRSIRYVGESESLEVSFSTDYSLRKAKDHIGLKLMTLKESMSDGLHSAELTLAEIFDEAKSLSPDKEELAFYIPFRLQSALEAFVIDDKTWTETIGKKHPFGGVSLFDIFFNFGEWILEKTPNKAHPVPPDLKECILAIQQQPMDNESDFLRFVPPDWMRNINYVMTLDNGRLAYVGFYQITDHNFRDEEILKSVLLRDEPNIREKTQDSRIQEVELVVGNLKKSVEGEQAKSEAWKKGIGKAIKSGFASDPELKLRRKSKSKHSDSSLSRTVERIWDSSLNGSEPFWIEKRHAGYQTFFNICFIYLKLLLEQDLDEISAAEGAKVRFSARLKILGRPQRSLNKSTVWIVINRIKVRKAYHKWKSEVPAS